MTITIDQIELPDEVLARVMPECFDPKSGVDVEAVREVLSVLIAQRAGVFAPPMSYIEAAGVRHFIKLVPVKFRAEVER